jgi:hypothetical protein
MAVVMICFYGHCNKKNGDTDAKKGGVPCGLTKSNMQNEWNEAIGWNVE